MKNKEKHFILFANCIPVKGFNRSIICDLQISRYVFIPNSLYELTQYFRTDSINNLLTRFNELDENTLSEYLDYLLDQGMGFYTDNPDEFPELQQSFQTPYLLNDCIIELSERNIDCATKILNELQVTGCQNLELRSYDYFDLELLFQFIEKLKYTRIRNVEVYNSFSESINISSLNEYLNNCQIVSRFYVHSSPIDKVQEQNDRLIFITDKINSNKCCGNISPHYFTVNLPFFLEAKDHNSCLYRKIALDQQGNIKNCPSLPSTFGNIETTGFLDIIDQLAFRELWHINKDQINTCKDCEFRYICSDCRAFLSNSKDKPVKCNYNPYINVYENQ